MENYRSTNIDLETLNSFLIETSGSLKQFYHDQIRFNLLNTKMITYWKPTKPYYNKTSNQLVKSEKQRKMKFIWIETKTLLNYNFFLIYEYWPESIQSCIIIWTIEAFMTGYFLDSPLYMWNNKGVFINTRNQIKIWLLLSLFFNTLLDNQVTSNNENSIIKNHFLSIHYFPVLVLISVRYKMSYLKCLISLRFIHEKRDYMICLESNNPSFKHALCRKLVLWLFFPWF